MKNENKKIVKILSFIEKKVRYYSPNESNIKLGIKISDLDKLKIPRNDIEEIFLLLKRNGLIKITDDLIFDFNGLYKKIENSTKKKLFGNKKKMKMGDYEYALLSITIDKEWKKMRKEGEIRIILKSSSCLKDFKEKIDNKDNENVYKIDFNNDRRIVINGYELAKPNLDSENDIFFEYICNNPGREIRREELEAGVRRKIKKKLTQIISELGFKDDIKKAFFPIATDKIVKFINPITKKYLKENKIKMLKLNKK